MRILELTLVDASALRNTATVFSCDDTSSIVFGRLFVRSGPRVHDRCEVSKMSAEKRGRRWTHYFSTHGCNLGSTEGPAAAFEMKVVIIVRCYALRASLQRNDSGKVGLGCSNSVRT